MERKTQSTHSHSRRAGVNVSRDQRAMRTFDGPQGTRWTKPMAYKGLQRKPRWRNKWHNFRHSQFMAYADAPLGMVLLIALALLIYSAGFGIEHLVYGG